MINAHEVHASIFLIEKELAVLVIQYQKPDLSARAFYLEVVCIFLIVLLYYSFHNHDRQTSLFGT